MGTTSFGYNVAQVEGEVCVAISASSDFAMARDLARETGRDLEIRYVIPREGAVLWIDVLAIPADAPHPDNAHRLLDYLALSEEYTRRQNREFDRFRTGQ